MKRKLKQRRSLPVTGSEPGRRGAKQPPAAALDEFLAIALREDAEAAGPQSRQAGLALLRRAAADAKPEALRSYLQNACDRIAAGESADLALHLKRSPRGGRPRLDRVRDSVLLLVAEATLRQADWGSPRPEEVVSDALSAAGNRIGVKRKATIVSAIRRSGGLSAGTLLFMLSRLPRDARKVPKLIAERLSPELRSLPVAELQSRLRKARRKRTKRTR